MGATSSTGIISYINLDYKNFGYKIDTTILTNHMQTTWGAKTGENQSPPIKNRRILRTFSTIRDVIDVSHKLNCNLAWISLKIREPFTE